MSAQAERSGSRFLYAPFEAAHARIDANERVAQERWAALDYRLGRIEAGLEQLDRRLWLAVYGVVGVVLAEGAAQILAAMQ
ncbi:hypothetical protein C8N32_10247 [Rhodovulum imhoffii]|uniref:Uncharacterized protein n=1 Tax=Rhodovulum imhoffii TaxID=365340 RepID=A0A2T5BVB8_9RHOB|nr:hypothetical protein [Rhodovulum imhoffii]MBK5934227.1 hypothetical protein [Rhodovulum imhoffii]PTN03526.1 hypothetical protein C8N32_10247 [Rhodovulum imhoffii]